MSEYFMEINLHEFPKTPFSVRTYIKNKNFNVLFAFAISVIFVASCIDKKKPAESEFFPIYVDKDVDRGISTTTVPVIDKLIPISKKLSLKRKLLIISDSLSTGYFHNLKIVVKKIDSVKGKRVLYLELKEKNDYKGPGSLPSYQSWYDYFQGSTGGTSTTIILKETFLQRHYKGDWIDAIIFYYEGNEIGNGWDHIALGGKISRY
jgi:hypothetical protein